MPPAEITARLRELGDLLTAQGWIARLQAEPGRAPCLHVQNPASAPLAERIYCAPRDASGALWFWWSWAEPISQDTDETAGAITRALRPRPGF
jgi:hypothetical protein